MSFGCFQGAAALLRQTEVKSVLVSIFYPRAAIRSLADRALVSKTLAHVDIQEFFVIIVRRNVY